MRKKLKVMAVLAFSAMAMGLIGCFTFLGIEIAQERRLDKLNQKNRDNLDAYKNAQYKKLDEDLENGLINDDEWKAGRNKVNLTYKHQYYIEAASNEDAEEYSKIRDNQVTCGKAVMGFSLPTAAAAFAGTACTIEPNSKEEDEKDQAERNK